MATEEEISRTTQFAKKKLDEAMALLFDVEVIFDLGNEYRRRLYRARVELTSISNTFKTEYRDQLETKTTQRKDK